MIANANSLSFSHSGERSIVGSNVMRCGAALRARSNSQRSWSTVPCGACVADQRSIAVSVKVPAR